MTTSVSTARASAFVSGFHRPIRDRQQIAIMLVAGRKAAAGRLKVPKLAGVVPEPDQDMQRRTGGGHVQTDPLAKDDHQDRHGHAIAPPVRQIVRKQLVPGLSAIGVGHVMGEGAVVVPRAGREKDAAQNLDPGRGVGARRDHRGQQVRNSALTGQNLAAPRSGGLSGHRCRNRLHRPARKLLLNH